MASRTLQEQWKQCFRCTAPRLSPCASGQSPVQGHSRLCTSIRCSSNMAIRTLIVRNHNEHYACSATGVWWTACRKNTQLTEYDTPGQQTPLTSLASESAESFSQLAPTKSADKHISTHPCRPVSPSKGTQQINMFE